MILKIQKHFILILLVTFLFPIICKAKLLQILHTNDLHSYFDGSIHNHSSGGYQNIKSMIDKFKAEANNKSIETLVMDAGDFMEGTIFYMANFGRNSILMHNKMGYDFALVGNHDFLMGIDDLNQLLGTIDLDFNYLSANISVPSRYKSINEKINPYKIINYHGVKLAIMGLTTSEFLYSWRLQDGRISNPINSGEKLAKKLKKDLGVDAIIALTHIGLRKDKKLAKKAHHIDLIIGGHSHTSMIRPFYQRSKDNKPIPIVQAGEHGKFLGRLLVDVTKLGINVINYELVPVEATPNPDDEILELIDQSYQALYDLYGEDYLNDIVSYSYLEPDSKEAIKAWTFFIADSMKESIKTQISIHQENTSGPNYPIGDITNFDLLNSHPRWLDFKDIMGWKIYRMEVSGFLLRCIFKVVMNFGLPLSITGITFKWHKTPLGKYQVKNLRIKGKKIKYFKKYTIAIPEGIIRGGIATSAIFRHLIKNSQRTSINIVDSIRSKLKRDGGVGNDYLAREDYRAHLLNLSPIDRTYFQGDSELKE